jgi:serine/threonine-protein kinase RsbT
MSEPARARPAGAGDATVMAIACHADIVAARRAGRELAEQRGFKPVDCAQIATAISELARNICLYAGTGTVYLVTLDEGGRAGIEIVAEDHGPGIADPDLAMRDGYSTSRGLGLGLPGTRRLMDEFAITTSPGVGTTVRARKWRGR